MSLSLYMQNMMSSGSTLSSYSNYLEDVIAYNSNINVNKELNKTSFDAAISIHITLDVYLQRIVKLAEVEVATLICAISYMRKFCEEKKIYLLQDNCYLLMFISIVVSLKMNEDCIYSDKDLAKMGGISHKKLILLETYLLEAIDYKLFCSQLYPL